ncbi:MAG: low specificity L-threonine aldolase [Bacteroidia bacterium]
MNHSKKFFASDNCSGIHPKILQAISDANEGHVKGYGYDFYTKEAEMAFKSIFGDDIEVYFVYSGTASNVLALESCIRPFEAVICSDVAHIHTDEAGAPERHLMSKLITLPSENGKIKAKQIPDVLMGRGVEHHVQPKVISITQSTEYGTLYSIAEIEEIVTLAKKENLFVHLDGARISNATAALGIDSLKKIKSSGLDVMSFGGTKNGMMMGEAIVFFNKDLAKNFLYRRKQGMQLASKMRFIAAQFTAFFKDNLWIELASHSNKMASILEDGLRQFDEITITQPVDVNGVFCIFPKGVAEILQNKFPFYVWNEFTNEVRLMTSWDTELSDIHQFLDEVKKHM